MDEFDFVIRLAIDRYGHIGQTVVAIEELSELTKELTKQIRGKGNHEHLVEEVADVLICVKQVKEMYNISEDELAETVRKKVSRLHKRMKEDVA